MVDPSHILFGILAGICLLGGFSFNRLKALQNRSNQAMADIDVQLRHRHDLIPNIAQIVHNIAGQEMKVIDNVIAARSEALAATTFEQKLTAETAVGNSLTNLFAAVDKFPELKSSKYFADLKTDVFDVENNLAASRRFLNLTTNEYNTALGQFPGTIIGPLFGMKPQVFPDLGEDRQVFESAPAIKAI